MNKERILALADLIEAQPHTGLNEKTGFNMGEYRHECGTPACIAGWAAAASVGDTTGTIKLEMYADIQAQQFLDLDGDQASALFQPPCEDEDEWDEITPDHAAFTLRHLVKTGKVDWSAFEDRADA
jgi:hypothetical protein